MTTNLTPAAALSALAARTVPCPYIRDYGADHMAAHPVGTLCSEGRVAQSPALSEPCSHWCHQPGEPKEWCDGTCCNGTGTRVKQLADVHLEDVVFAMATVRDPWARVSITHVTPNGGDNMWEVMLDEQFGGYDVDIVNAALLALHAAMGAESKEDGT